MAHAGDGDDGGPPRPDGGHLVAQGTRHRLPQKHILDCPTDAEIELGAYNAAFYEIGLPWHWDDSTYERLATVPCERSRLRQYMENMQPHLLRAYDAEFLVQAIERTRAQIAAA